MKKSASLDPAVALPSHRILLASWPRRSATTGRVEHVAPNCGVKPPGKRSGKEKQFGPAKTRASVA